MRAKKLKIETPKHCQLAKKNLLMRVDQHVMQRVCYVGSIFIIGFINDRPKKHFFHKCCYSLFRANVKMGVFLFLNFNFHFNSNGVLCLRAAKDKKIVLLLGQ